MRFLPSLLLVLLFWSAIYLPGLGDAELKGEEGRRILPAREMLRRGDYLLPYSEGRPYHRKPPGINWAIAASFTLTGSQSEWSARLPSVLAVLALAVTGLWAGRRLLGPEWGLALGLACLANLGMIEKGRLAEIEALYVSLAGMGLFLWAAWWVEGKSSWLVWLPAAVPFALANLVKGPVFMAFVCPVMVLTLWRAKRLRELLHPAAWLSLAAALGPMIAWGMMIQGHMAELSSGLVLDDDDAPVADRTAQEVWWQQIAGRLSYASIDWGDWLALPFRSALLFAPWLVLALVLWVRLRKAQPAATPERMDALFRGLGLGSLLSAALFCLLPATRSRYLFPLLASVTLWSVMVVRRATQTPESAARVWRIWRWIVAFLGTVAAGAGLALPWILHGGNPWCFFLTNLAVAAALLAWLGLAWRGRLPAPIFTSTAGVAAAVALVAATTVLPWSRSVDNIRPLAATLTAHATKPGIIVAINPGPQPFLYYLGTRCVEAAKITDFPEDVDYILIRPCDWADADWRDRLEWRGFRRIVTTVKDARSSPQREYLLIDRPDDP